MIPPIIDEVVNMIRYMPLAVSNKPNPHAPTLDSNCYHLEECLVKEAFKMIYTNADNIDTQIMVPYFMENKNISEAAHKRIRDKLYYVRE